MWKQKKRIRIWMGNVVAGALGRGVEAYSCSSWPVNVSAHCTRSADYSIISQESFLSEFRVFICWYLYWTLEFPCEAEPSPARDD